MMRKVHKYTILKTLLLFSFVILPLMGSNCNNILTGTSNSVQGNWKLTFIQGNLEDVCFGEIVNFPSDAGGTATLTCPGASPVSEAYTVSNNEITYTRTGVKYTITSSSSGTLVLTGTFNTPPFTSTRILTYSKITAADNQSVTAPPNQVSKNSSAKVINK